MTLTPALLRNYLTILSGSAGRLVLSLVYFLIIANGLSLADFGVFAAASAAGVMAARALAFGFVSPLYRAATVKPRLLGAYFAGFAALALASLPLLALIGWGLHQALFAGRAAGWAIALILFSEMVLWRLVEVVAIVNNGLNRFARAATLVIIGSGLRSLAAVGFWLWGGGGLGDWALAYLACTALSAALALGRYLPRARWRWRPALYRRRMGDAVAAAGADMAFYVQSELDKILVLSLAGPRSAGLYAIALRVVDLTAMPIRSFNQMLVQHVMAARSVVSGWRKRAGIEAGIGLVSIAGLVAVIILLWLWPNALGRNIGSAALLFPALLLVPAFRNLVEYHAELLYARERTASRMLLLIGLGALKAGLMTLVILAFAKIEAWALWLNPVFAIVWLVSAAVTYRLLAPAR